ncbi:SRPBCC family protein [Billgrantia lactosivorans]|uniref:SRPBCC family protein n=1 Tax=Billgrantia lactosivorans TaxID=2185141 RepID=UPI000DABA7A7|nr:SRPBCC family protein [Halomonas lactosivorans]
MAKFAFDTTWDFDAPVEAVFDALADPLHWPDWWPGLVEARQLEAGNEQGIGRIQHFVWKSRLGYYLRFDIRITRVCEPSLIEGEASGDVAGFGRWQLHGEKAGTRVRYLWQVRTVPPRLGLLACMARPLVVWNHHAMMRDGHAGLVRYFARLAPSRCKGGRLAS